MTRLDRRALFTSGAAAALLAASGLSLSAAPRMGGTLRIAVPRDDDSLTAVARAAVYDRLTEIGPDGVLRPELAVSWDGDAEARHWTFALHEGVTFHDGSALSAQDAADSLMAHSLPDVARAEATGPLRLRIELNAANPDLPFHLAASELIIAPGGAVDLPLARALGTGAYRVARAQQGRGFLGQRVDGHYKAGRAGWADTVEIVVIPDAKVRAEALRDGFVDIAALPQADGLIGRGEFLYHPSDQDMALAARPGVGIPRVVSAGAPLDDWRIAERWWIS